MDSRTRAVPVLLALGLTWGCSFLFIKVLLDNTGPLEIALVSAAAMYGCGTVYTRSTLHGEDTVSVSLIQLTLAALFLLPITLAVTSGAPDYSMSLKAYGSIAVLGLVGTGLAYIAFFWL